MGSRAQPAKSEGVVIALVACAAVGILALVALVVDLALLELFKYQQRNSTESAAIAGAYLLASGRPPDDPTRVAIEAIATAQPHVFQTADARDTPSVEFLNAASADCTSAIGLNGVRVRLMAASKEQGLKPMFAGILGVEFTGTSSEATAFFCDTAAGRLVRLVYPGS